MKGLGGRFAPIAQLYCDLESFMEKAEMAPTSNEGLRILLCWNGDITDDL